MAKGQPKKPLSKTAAEKRRAVTKYSRVVMLREFGIAGHLTIIQLTDTILFGRNNPDQGASLFVELMESLLAQTPPGRKPVFIWLAIDVDSLRHVVRETKLRNPDLFDQLASHSILGKASHSSSFYEAYRLNRQRAAYNGYAVLTASAASSDRKNTRYSYNGHYNPENRGKTWRNGAQCTTIRRAPEALKQIVKDLHLAHCEFINKTQIESNTVAKLAAEGITISRLEDVIT